ncbi:S-layer homology domain-containing protein [Ammoniphilus resinae]|uniref:SLH domain-containing protein n=1 Tax=Ammoniphilus resinae TaxID=861532 RepID=A0ABS4GLA8_9BACL|nr:S-layer homology domain-containing protein [Ammoniphilus resinae]MBP1930700.1 hypothetical protein [Ammoniphilus resinae]
MRMVRQGLILFLLLVLLMSGCSSDPDKLVPDASIPSPSTTTMKPVDSEDETTAVKIKVIFPPSQIEEGPVEAKDISGHPAEGNIQVLLQSGAVKLKEIGQFKPDEPITRGEFISWMYGYDSKRIKPHIPKRSSYSDLNKDHPFYPIVEGITAAGIVMGYPDGTIGLDRMLTRQEIGQIWGRYQLHGNVLNPIENTKMLVRFADKDEIGEEFIYAVASYLNVYQEIFGKLTQFEPQKEVTRAQAASWIVQAPENVTKLNQIQEEPLNENESLENAQVVEVVDLANHPVQKQIVSLIEAGVIKVENDQHVHPDDMITRREFIEWMYEHDPKGIEQVNPSQSSFPDVSISDPLYEVVEGLIAKNRIIGQPDGTLQLDKTLTREELALLWGIYKQHQAVIDHAEFVKNPLNYAKDGDQVDEYFQYAVGAYYPYFDEVFGNTPIINPQGEVTRAEAALWITETSN